jgi:acetyl-CoA carboxylase biotin carboxyl carrier protein
MADNKKAHPQEEPSALLRFIREQLAPLSRAFAASELAELRVRTPQGSATLVKATAAPNPLVEMASGEPVRGSAETSKPAARYAPLVPAQNGEAGRTYITINSEVVGIYHAANGPLTPGDQVSSGQVLGYIEALRLRNEVRCPTDATLVAQVVVDNQPVDFGEALFVLDTTGTFTSEVLVPSGENAAAAAVAQVVEVEPPRM